MKSMEAHSTATRPATWQRLKRHADLLPLRPHPSYFLSYRPLRHNQQPPSSRKGSPDAEPFSHIPASPRGMSTEDPVRDTMPFRRPAISDHHKSRASVMEVESGRSVHVDDLQFDQRRNRWSATVAKTESSLARNVRASVIPNVSSDPLLKSNAGFQVERRSALSRCNSLSDLSEEKSSSFHCRKSRPVTQMSCSNQQADNYAAKRPDSCNYRTQFGSLSAPLIRTAPEQICMDESCMTSDARGHFAFCTAQASTGDVISDISPCRKSIDSSTHIYLKTSRESSAAKTYKTEIHSTSPLVRAIYSAKTADIDGMTQRVLNKQRHALYDTDDINSTFHHSNGNDTDASSSTSAHAHIPDKTFVAEKQQKPTERKMAFTSLEHTSPSHSGGMRRTRSESQSAPSPSNDRALVLQSPPLTTALTLDIANMSPVYGAKTSSSYNMSKKASDLSTFSLKGAETGLLTMIDDSRKRRPCSDIQSEREQTEDHVLQSQKEAPGEDNIVETRSRCTKRPKISGFHIKNLTACEIELEQISHTQAQGHDDDEKPSLCVDEHENLETELQLEVDVVSDNQPETEQFIPNANIEKVLSIDSESDDIHQHSLGNDGLCQVSRQIRSAIMKESYEVSQMKHTVCEDKQSRLTVDVCSNNQGSSGAKNICSEYPELHYSIPQPISLFVNSSKNTDLVFSEWNAYRNICNNQCQESKQTMSQCSSPFERQHSPHSIVQDTEVPAFLTFQMYIRNPEHSSLISSHGHFHKTGALQRVRQNLRLPDLIPDKHTCEQGSPHGHTATLCGLPSCRPGGLVLKPDMDIRPGKLSDQQASHESLHGVLSSQSGRVEKRQWTSNGLYDRQETVSFNSKSIRSFSPQIKGVMDNGSHTQPQRSDLTRYHSPVSTQYFPASQTYSARGSLGSDANGLLNTLPCLEPSVTGSPQSGKLRCAVSHAEKTDPQGYPGLLWPLKPIPRYPCSQRRHGVLCPRQNKTLPTCKAGAPYRGKGSALMGATIR